MNVESTEQVWECEPQRASVVAMFARRFESLERRFPRKIQSLLSILDQSIVSGTSFVTAAIIGRLTTLDQLGLYYLVLSIVLIIATIEDCVVTAPYLVYSKRRAGRELEEYTGSVWVQHFLLCAVSVVVLLALVLIMSITGPSSLLPGLWVLLGVTPLILLRQALRRMAIANLHVRSAVALDLVVAVAQLGGIVLLGLFGTLSLASIFAVMGGACGIAGIVLYWFDPPTMRFVRQRFVPDWRGNWAFAKWALRGFIVGSTTPFLLLWILDWTAGPAAAGVFGACGTLIGMMNILLLGLNNVLTPQAAHAFTRGGPENLRRMLVRTSLFLMTTLGGFCLLIMFTGDWLMVLAFGEVGRDTGAVLEVLALSMLISGAGLVAGCGLWAIDEPRANFHADVTCLVVTLATALLIVPFGVLGAALASLAGIAVSVVVRMISFTRCLHRAAAVHRGGKSHHGALTESQAASTDRLDVTCIERSHCLVEAGEAAV
jgi:O-antigen/teichoic acid export membrane protein